EGRRAAVEPVHVVTHELADGGNAGLIQVRAVPLAALLPQQEADDAVVGPDVQANLAVDLADQTLDLPVLLLLQDRATEKRERPFRGRVHALAPDRPDRAAHATRVGSNRST